MQRLFSMFPTGTAGIALLLLRVSIAATLVANGTAYWAPVPSGWVTLGLVMVAIPLCLGLLTPYCSIVGCLIQGFVLSMSAGRNGFHLANSILTCGVLAILGPGAYSIDARIFGRRLLTLSPRK